MEIDMKEKLFSVRRLFKAILGIFLVCVFLVAAMVYFSSSSDKDVPFNNMKFDEVTWKKMANSEDPDNKRGLMFQDVTENYLRKGLSKQDVLGLLGEPDNEKTENKYSYNLGMWSGYRMDYDSLDIEFDYDGKFIKSYRVQH
jgi:hypothetical protein